MQRKKHNTKYSPEFKKSVIMDMRENHLACEKTIWRIEKRCVSIGIHDHAPP